MAQDAVDEGIALGQSASVVVVEPVGDAGVGKKLGPFPVQPIESECWMPVEPADRAAASGAERLHGPALRHLQGAVRQAAFRKLPNARHDVCLLYTSPSPRDS